MGYICKNCGKEMREDGDELNCDGCKRSVPLPPQTARAKVISGIKKAGAAADGQFRKMAQNQSSGGGLMGNSNGLGGSYFGSQQQGKKRKKGNGGLLGDMGY